jgi:hypothetical protein
MKWLVHMALIKARGVRIVHALPQASDLLS